MGHLQRVDSGGQNKKLVDENVDRDQHLLSYKLKYKRDRIMSSSNYHLIAHFIF